MNGFDSHEIPEWVTDRFDERTSLPRGPLEHLPIPLGGRIIGARAQVPSNGSAPHWTVSVSCSEPVRDTTRFFEEFLPLAGYEIVGIGAFRGRRLWFGRDASRRNQLIVFRTAQYLGRVTIEAHEETTSRAQVEMAHCQHQLVRELVDREELRLRTDIEWRFTP